MPTDHDIDLVFRALADPVRRRIVELLRTRGAGCCGSGGEICGCDLETPLGLAQATISHHMKCLCLAELVSAEKRGRWVYYRLNAAMFERARGWLGGFVDMPGATDDAPTMPAALANAATHARR